MTKSQLILILSCSFLYNETLPFHPNGLTFLADIINGDTISETFYSIGGFVIKEGEKSGAKAEVELPFPINTADNSRTGA
jgi:L-serine dehydratase